MNRRQFLKTAAWSGLLAGCPGGLRLHAAEGGYTGKLLVHLQVDGGWDVTSFCDPKLNVPGERLINNWANTSDIQTAGNLSYAPIPGAQAFFDKYRDYMLVINGVDAQTNAHTTGVQNNGSGQIAAGFPSLGAVFASANAPELPLSYINNGGFAETNGLLRASRIGNPDTLIDVLRPNANPYGIGDTWFPDPVMGRLRAASEARRSRLLAAENPGVRARANRIAFDSSLVAAESLSELVDLLPAEGAREPVVGIGRSQMTLRQQIQLGVLSCRAGVACAVDLLVPDLDTHNDHDERHQPILSFMAESIDYLWEYAEANGIADRMLVYISSDFGRTPFYNSYAGKDHWPIGSSIVMEKNVAWGNRVVGATDEGHNAFSINPATLQRDDRNGTNIYPRHIHKALRTYLGVAQHPSATAYPFLDTEDFDFFDPAKSTG